MHAASIDCNTALNASTQQNRQSITKEPLGWHANAIAFNLQLQADMAGKHNSNVQSVGGSGRCWHKEYKMYLLEWPRHRPESQ